MTFIATIPSHLHVGFSVCTIGDSATVLIVTLLSRKAHTDSNIVDTKLAK